MNRPIITRQEEKGDPKTIKSSVISDRQRAVIETIRMRLTHVQSLAYMKGVGFPLSAGTYKREKRKINALKLERLHNIAAIGFEDQHLDRIDNCEMIQKLMWENYLLERSPYKRVMILKEIKELQPYISSYYDATRSVMQLSRPVPAYDPNTEPLPDIE